MADERRHFRIDLEALVSCKELTEQEAFQLAAEIKSQSPTTGTVDSETVKLNKQIQDSITAISSNNLQMGHLLNLFNRKINLLFGEIEVMKAKSAESGGPITKEMPINISGGGALIYSDIEFAPGTLLDLKITFIPEHVAIRSVSRVIKAFTNSPDDRHGNWKIALEFAHMHDEDQDRVVRKVLQEQTKQLRAQKRAEHLASEDDTEF